MSNHAGATRLRGGSILTIVLALIFVVAANVPRASAADPQEFGVSSFTTSVKDAAGNDETQAGAHPVSANTTFRFNATAASSIVPVEDVRSIRVDLPAGFIGNPQAVTGTCEVWNLTNKTCPDDSIVGAATLQLLAGGYATSPVWNMVPEPGYPAEFGLATTAMPPQVLYPRIRSDGDYGLTMDSLSVAAANVMSVDLTFCGFGTNIAMDTPGAPGLGWTFSGCKAPTDAGSNPTPFLTNPTDCSAGPPATTLTVDSWQHPRDYKSYTAYATSPPAPVTGCDQLAFHPTIDVRPATTQADTPAAYDVHIENPQTNDAETLATPSLKDATVTLPNGVALNPGAADGLKGCSDDEFGLHSLQEATCPAESKVGTVHIATPLLAETSGDFVPEGASGPHYQLSGSIYLRQPDTGATRADGMYAIFLDVEDAQTGITVKLKGDVVPDANTGQLTATFEDNPPLPFTDFLLTFFGGSRASLANPVSCGTATTNATFSSWGGPKATPTSSFTVDADGHGGACPAARPFSPTFTAGTLNPFAGGFSPFTMTVRRQDGQQELKNVKIEMPSGLLGVVKGVPRCGESDAAAGTCDAASQIGTTTVSAGSGDQPYSLPGKVFLGGRYKGEPLSLSIVVRAVAGPFDLGTVVVRAPIHVDAANARLTVPADDLPTILQGVPLRLKTINVTLDRPNFTFNATSCDQQAIAGTLLGTDGAVASVASPYQASGCANLPFHPAMSARTSAKLRFKQGASLVTRISQTPGEAAIKSVAVTLPKQLPSRLIPTINNACLLEQYRRDYRACPADSYVGTVTATTPVLSGALSGPAYIVAIPNDVPIIALQLFGQGENEGIDLDLNGTIIVDSGGGRSRVTFSTVPDVPIDSFQLDLPSGPHSALDAPSYDLCRGPMTMGVSMVAQNGKRQDWNQSIAVDACPKVPALTVTHAPRYEKGVGKGFVKVSVRVPAAGRLYISGKGLVAGRKVVVKKGGYVLRTRVVKATRTRLRTHAMTIAAKVIFQPDNAPKASAVATRAKLGPTGRRRK